MAWSMYNVSYHDTVNKYMNLVVPQDAINQAEVWLPRDTFLTQLKSIYLHLSLSGKSNYKLHIRSSSLSLVQHILAA